MTAELNRKIANIIKQGVIAESDPARALVRVQHGELTSDWLPYFVPFAGGVSVHRPPERRRKLHHLVAKRRDRQRPSFMRHGIGLIPKPCPIG